MRIAPIAAVCLFHMASLLGQSAPAAAAHRPSYTADGRLMPLTDYREWVYLTSGLDMSYTPRAGMEGHSMFDNVFVNPEAYHSFIATGTWPDNTMMVREDRGAQSHGSINKAGQFQSEGLMAVEVHVKDLARGGWSFYMFNSDAPGALLPKQADCYSCHHDHAAVDTTFVQFYPTLMPTAREKKTLSAEYLKDPETTNK